MGEAALRLDHVTKRYAGVTAVADLSLAVEPGEMFGLIGPDGAGKTTTIRLLCGLLHPDAGQVRVMGRDPVGQHGAVTRELGYLSQRFSLYGDLSIDENIAFFAEIHDQWQYEERRRRLLDLTGLLPFRSRLADRLSGGMKQKLALACTLVHEPRVILLDEPTTGVDPVSRREFWRLLAEFLEQGITILVSTPYLDEAERCHRVALLHEGRLLALDTPDRIRRSLPGQMVEAIVDDQAAALPLISAHAAVADVHVFGERMHVRIRPEVAADGARLVATELESAGIGVRSVRGIPASLEDVFIARLTAAPAASAPQGPE
jgi:ABC-2 type transport system ATP-binding protein